MAKDKQTVLATARKDVTLDRDNLGQRTTISSSKPWNIGGLLPIRAPFGFQIWFTKKDGEPGKWIGSVSHTPEGWVWLEYNALIVQLPTGGRLESPHRMNFKSDVIIGSGGTVSEQKLFFANEIIDELVTCFNQDEPIQIRVGHTDFQLQSTFLAYVVAIQEMVKENKL